MLKPSQQKKTVTTPTASDEITVTVHAFKDENENGIQDDEEEDAGGFFVYAHTGFRSCLPSLDFIDKTDISGDISFKWEKNSMITIGVYESDDLDSDQFKGLIGGTLKIEYVPDEDITYILPLRYIEKKSLETNPKQIISNPINENTVTVTVHTFYDRNGNGIQDSDPDLFENDAINMLVFSDVRPYLQPGLRILDYKGRTNNKGLISFETEQSPHFSVVAYEFWNINPSQWKGSIGSFLREIQDYDEVLEIPLTYHERKVIESTPNTVGWKWFNVKVLTVDGNPIEGAKVILHKISSSSLTIGHTKEDGEVLIRDSFKSDSPVEITAKVGAYEVSKVHSTDVTGRVDITLQYYTKSTTIFNLPIIAKLASLFPALERFLKI